MLQGSAGQSRGKPFYLLWILVTDRGSGMTFLRGNDEESRGLVSYEWEECMGHGAWGVETGDLYPWSVVRGLLSGGGRSRGQSCLSFLVICSSFVKITWTSLWTAKLLLSYVRLKLIGLLQVVPVYIVLQ